MRTFIAIAIFAVLAAGFCPSLAAQNNPVPFLNNPTVPAAVAPGGAAFMLTVNGGGFVNGATILWNGSARTTTLVSGTQLTAAILASDIATANLASVTVSNPSPGGGVSNPVLFSITTPTTSLAFTQSGGTEFDNWISQPTGLFAEPNPADGAPVLAVVNAKCVVQASCILDNGTIEIEYGGFFTQDIEDSPQTIVGGDFNGDGILDYITLGGDVHTETVFAGWVSLGISGGGLAAQKSFPLPSGSTASPAPVAGDFNRDGHLDIVTGGQSSVYFIPGNGDGTFGTPVASVTESALEGGMAAGDYNRDGILDLAVTNPLLGSVSILLGNGDGTFKAPADFATGSNPSTVVTGDFNGDGELDLAILDGSGTMVSILLGNGDGTFKTHVEYPAAASGFSLTLGDFNGDGILDVAASDTGGLVSFLLGNGDGTLQSPLDFATGGVPQLIATTSRDSGSSQPIGRAGVAVLDPVNNDVLEFSPVASQKQTGNPVPTISSVSPQSAIENGSAFTLTVTGTNFISSSTISFGGQMEPTAFLGATHLTAAVPASAITAVGPVTVLVTNPGPGGGIASANFSVLIPAPTVSSIIPAGAIVASPGFSMTINGTNFDDTATMLFNNAERAAALVSSTQLTVPVLASDLMNLGTIPIVVRNPQGTSSSLNFTVLPSNTQPAIASLVPNSAAAGGPAFTLQISGNAFGPSSVVTFGSTVVSSAYVNPAMLEASVPSSAIAIAGTPLVTVTNPGGSPSAGSPFSVGNGGNNPAPAAVSVLPTNVPAGNSSLTLTVTGSNFVQGSVVQVNGSTRPTTYVSATSLTAMLPSTDFAHSGTLSITVNNPAPGGGTTVQLSFVVDDYNVSAQSSSQTVTAGQNANYNLSLTAMNGTLGESVSFSATGLPSGASAGFTPSTLPAGSSSTGVALSISTTPHSSGSAGEFSHGIRPRAPWMYGFALAFAMICFALFSQRGRPGIIVPRLVGVALLAIVAGLAACGSNVGSSGTQTNPATGTPAGTYTITVNATSGNASVSTTVTLKVN